MHSVAAAAAPCRCRLSSSHKAAGRYIAQFPSATLNHAARFVAIVACSFAALLLFAAPVDDVLLERHRFGGTIVWCALFQGLELWGVGWTLCCQSTLLGHTVVWCALA